MEKVLITGGAGFIGSAIVKNLYGKFDLVVLDSFSPQIHGVDYKKSYLYQSIKDKCKIIQGNVCSREALQEALQDVEYVIHLAAETGTGQSMYEINRYTETNILGTSNLLETILREKLNIKKIILSSSRSVYGEGMYKCKDHGVVIPTSRVIKDMQMRDFAVKCPICNSEVKLCETKEDIPLAPISFYAYTKLAQEKMIETMCPTMEIPYTIFRYQNVYGAGQSLDNPYTGILSIFSKLLLQNKNINIFEDGEESRDFIHVSDIAKGTCCALNNIKTDNQCINIGTGIKISVIQLAETLRKLYNSTSQISISGDFRKGDIRHNIADITKLKDLCGFLPTYTFEEGMDEFTKWVKLQNSEHEFDINDGKYEYSLEEMKKMGMLIKGKN